MAHKSTSRGPLPFWLFVGLAFASSALADPRPTSAPQGVGKQCLDTLGIRHPAVCHSQNASRISVDPDICLCPAGLREVSVPYCEVGQVPPPQSKAADLARAKAAATGSLAGVSFEGRAFCEPRGRTGESPG